MKIHELSLINQITRYLCYSLLIISALRAINRYLYFESTITTIIIAIIIYLLFLSIVTNSNLSENKKIIRFIIPTVTILVLFIIFYLYPIADGLKVSMRGSDQDDCTIGIINNLLNGINPYHFISYNGNTCAQGPGVIIIFFPFVILSKYIFAHLFYLILIFLILYKYRNNFNFNKFFVIFFSSIILWEMLSVGSDLYVSSILLCISCILLNEGIKEKNLRLIIVSAIIIGIFSTTRINFIYIPFAISILLFVNWKKEAVIYFIVSSVFCLGPLIFLFIINNQLISINSENDYSFIFIHASNISNEKIINNLIGLIFSIIAFVYFFLKLRTRQNVNLLLLSIFYIIFPHLLSVSINDLMYKNFDLTNWEGANFIVPVLSFAILLLSKKKLS